MGKENIRNVSILGQSQVGGQIHHYDDFEDLFKWASSGDGDGAATKDTDKALNGNASMKLLSDSGTPAEDQFVRAQLLKCAQPANQYEIRFDFLIVDVSDVKTLQGKFTYTNGTTRYIMQMNLLPSTNAMEIRTGASEYTTISDYDLILKDNYWNSLVLAFDLSNGQYLQAVINEHTYNLSDHYFSPQTVTAENSAEVAIAGICAGANQIELYIDDYLIRLRDP